MVQRGLLLNLCFSMVAASVMAGCLGTGLAAPSPNTTQPGLRGRVIDAATRKGLSDASVTVQGLTVLTVQPASHSLARLQKGPSLVVVTHTGYADVTRTVTITGVFYRRLRVTGPTPRISS